MSNIFIVGSYNAAAINNAVEKIVVNLTFDQHEALQSLRHWAIENGVELRILSKYYTHPTMQLLAFLRANDYEIVPTISHILECIQVRKSKCRSVPKLEYSLILNTFTKTYDMLHQWHCGFDKIGRRPVIYKKFTNEFNLIKLCDIINGKNVSLAEMDTDYYSNVMNLHIDALLEYSIEEFEICCKLCYNQTIQQFQYIDENLKYASIVNSVVIVYDLEGMSFQKIRTEFFKYTYHVLQLAQAQYPSLIGNIFIINAPLGMGSLYQLFCRTWMHPRVVSVIHVFGMSSRDKVKWMDKLNSVIGFANMPENYGGSLPLLSRDTSPFGTYIFDDISSEASTAFAMDPDMYENDIDKLGTRNKRSKARDSNFRKSLNAHQIRMLEYSNDFIEESDRLTKLNTLRNASVNGSVIEGSEDDEDGQSGDNDQYAFYNPRPIATARRHKTFELAEELERSSSELEESYASIGQSDNENTRGFQVESNLAPSRSAQRAIGERKNDETADPWKNELDFIKDMKVNEEVGVSILKRDTIKRHNDKTRERKRVRILDEVDVSSPEPYVDSSQTPVSAKKWYQCICCGFITIANCTKRVAEENSLTRLRTFLTVAIAFYLVISLGVMILSIYTLVKTAWIGNEVIQQRHQAWTTVLVLLLSSFLVAVNYVGYIGARYKNRLLLVLYASCLGIAVLIFGSAAVASGIYAANIKDVNSRINGEIASRQNLSADETRSVIEQYNLILAISSASASLCAVVPMFLCLAFMHKLKLEHMRMNKNLFDVALLPKELRIVLKVTQVIAFAFALVMIVYGTTVLARFYIQGIFLPFFAIFGLIYGGVALMVSTLFAFEVSVSNHRGVVHIYYAYTVPVVTAVLIFASIYAFVVLSQVRSLVLRDFAKMEHSIDDEYELDSELLLIEAFVVRCLIVTGILTIFAALFQVVSFVSARYLYHSLRKQKYSATAMLSEGLDIGSKLDSASTNKFYLPVLPLNMDEIMIKRRNFLADLLPWNNLYSEDAGNRTGVSATTAYYNTPAYTQWSTVTHTRVEKALACWGLIMGLVELSWNGTFVVFSLGIKDENSWLATFFAFLGLVDARYMEADSFIVSSAGLLSVVVGPMLLWYSWATFVRAEVRHVVGIIVCVIQIFSQILLYLTEIVKGFVDFEFRNAGSIILLFVVINTYRVVVPFYILKYEYQHTIRSAGQSDIMAYNEWASKINCEIDRKASKSHSVSEPCESKALKSRSNRRESLLSRSTMSEDTTHFSGSNIGDFNASTRSFSLSSESESNGDEEYRSCESGSSPDNELDAQLHLKGVLIDADETESNINQGDLGDVGDDEVSMFESVTSALVKATEQFFSPTTEQIEALNSDVGSQWLNRDAPASSCTKSNSTSGNIRIKTPLLNNRKCETNGQFNTPKMVPIAVGASYPVEEDRKQNSDSSPDSELTEMDRSEGGSVDEEDIDLDILMKLKKV